MKDDAALKATIVLAMLPDVPFEGWSRGGAAQGGGQARP